MTDLNLLSFDLATPQSSNKSATISTGGDGEDGFAAMLAAQWSADAPVADEKVNEPGVDALPTGCPVNPFVISGAGKDLQFFSNAYEVTQANSLREPRQHPSSTGYTYPKIAEGAQPEAILVQSIGRSLTNKGSANTGALRTVSLPAQVATNKASITSTAFGSEESAEDDALSTLAQFTNQQPDALHEGFISRHVKSLIGRILTLGRAANDSATDSVDAQAPEPAVALSVDVADAHAEQGQSSGETGFRVPPSGGSGGFSRTAKLVNEPFPPEGDTLTAHRQTPESEETLVKTDVATNVADAMSSYTREEKPAQADAPSPQPEHLEQQAELPVWSPLTTSVVMIAASAVSPVPDATPRNIAQSEEAMRTARTAHVPFAEFYTSSVTTPRNYESTPGTRAARAQSLFKAIDQQPTGEPPVRSALAEQLGTVPVTTPSKEAKPGIPPASNNIDLRTSPPEGGTTSAARFPLFQGVIADNLNGSSAQQPVSASLSIEARTDASARDWAAPVVSNVPAAQAATTKAAETQSEVFKLDSKEVSASAAARSGETTPELGLNPKWLKTEDAPPQDEQIPSSAPNADSHPAPTEDTQQQGEMFVDNRRIAPTEDISAPAKPTSPLSIDQIPHLAETQTEIRPVQPEVDNGFRQEMPKPVARYIEADAQDFGNALDQQPVNEPLARTDFAGTVESRFVAPEERQRVAGDAATIERAPVLPTLTGQQTEAPSSAPIRDLPVPPADTAPAQTAIPGGEEIGQDVAARHRETTPRLILNLPIDQKPLLTDAPTEITSAQANDRLADERPMPAAHRNEIGALGIDLSRTFVHQETMPRSEASGIQIEYLGYDELLPQESEAAPVVAVSPAESKESFSEAVTIANEETTLLGARGSRFERDELRLRNLVVAQGAATSPVESKELFTSAAPLPGVEQERVASVAPHRTSPISSPVISQEVTGEQSVHADQPEEVNTSPETATGENSADARETRAQTTHKAVDQQPVAELAARPSSAEEKHAKLNPRGEANVDKAATDSPAPAANNAAVSQTAGAKVEEPNATVRQLTPPLIEASERLTPGKPHTLRLNLRPVELGQVEIQITRDAKGHLNAHMTVEREAAGHTLSEGIPQLREALERAGLQVDRLVVSTSTGWNGEGQAKHADAQQFTRTSEPNFFEADPVKIGGAEATEDRLLNLHA